MLFEHWIYSTAIAIIVGMIYYKHIDRDHSWIIIASAYVPDLDMIADTIFKRIGITVLIRGNPIEHGDFHNIAVLLLFGVLAALLLQTWYQTQGFIHICRYRVWCASVRGCVNCQTSISVLMADIHPKVWYRSF